MDGWTEYVNNIQFVLFKGWLAIIVFRQGACLVLFLFVTMFVRQISEFTCPVMKAVWIENAYTPD